MEPCAVDRLALGDGHRTHRPAVVRPLHVDDVLASSNAPRHLDRRLDGLRARRPEEERVQRRVRHHGQQPLDKLEIWLVVCNATLYPPIL